MVRLSDDRIIEVNESYGKLIGRAPSEVLGRTLTEHDPLLDPKVLPDVRRSLEQARAITGIDVRFHRNNGEVGTGVLYAEELQGAPDRHALLVLHDVTTRQLAEDKLKLANYDLQQFAYAAAHDLQEPARNISTALGQLNRSYRSALEADAIELIGDSIEAAKRMNQMIRDLLAFTHADREASLKEARVDGAPDTSPRAPSLGSCPSPKVTRKLQLRNYPELSNRSRRICSNCSRIWLATR